MARRKGYKRPNLEQFKTAVEACRGTIGKVAETLGVNRTTIYKWCNDDEKYAQVIEDVRGKALDEYLKSARILALGIPKLDDKKNVIGWKERPDGQMLRYLIGIYGRNEGFGESIDITSKGESIKTDPVVIEVIDSRDKVQTDNKEDE